MSDSLPRALPSRVEGVVLACVQGALGFVPPGLRIEEGPVLDVRGTLTCTPTIAFRQVHDRGTGEPALSANDQRLGSPKVYAQALSAAVDEEEHRVQHAALLSDVLARTAFGVTPPTTILGHHPRRYTLVTPCTPCDGKGHIVCATCKTTGLLACPECNAKGEIRCHECDARGEVRVASPDDPRQTRMDRCAVCHGTGKLECKRCYGRKRIQCKSCKGKGRFACEPCASTGKTWERTALVVEARFSASLQTDGTVPWLKTVLTDRLARNQSLAPLCTVQHESFARTPSGLNRSVMFAWSCPSYARVVQIAERRFPVSLYGVDPVLHSMGESLEALMSSAFDGVRQSLEHASAWFGGVSGSVAAVRAFLALPVNRGVLESLSDTDPRLPAPERCRRAHAPLAHAIGESHVTDCADLLTRFTDLVRARVQIIWWLPPILSSPLLVIGFKHWFASNFNTAAALVATFAGVYVLSTHALSRKLRAIAGDALDRYARTPVRVAAYRRAPRSAASRSPAPSSSATS